MALAHRRARLVQLDGTPTTTIERGVLDARRERGEMIAIGATRHVHHRGVFVLELGRGLDKTRPHGRLQRATSAQRAP